MTKDFEDCYTLAEMAETFGMPEGAVRSRAGRGAIPGEFRVIGGARYYLKRDINRWLSPMNGLGPSGYRTYLHPEPASRPTAEGVKVLQLSIELFLRAQAVRRRTTSESR